MTDRRAGPATRLAAQLLRTRWFARAPLLLYRAHLGFLVGSRLIMVEHVGRRTGARRSVVLEVVDHPAPDTYLVASGFGTRSQWFRNVQADPEVRIWAGRAAAVPASARTVGPADAAEAVGHYRQRHARTWSALRSVFEETLGAPVEQLPIVAFTLRRPPGSPRRSGSGG